MNQKDKNTEELILDAANKVFIEKGLDGTRMQEIADEAKINKSLLHYYYRSKDKLFCEVFNKAIQKFLPNTVKIFDSQKTLFEIIEIFIEEYIGLLQRNPFIPMFVLHELGKRPKKLSETFSHLFGEIKNNQLVFFRNMVRQEIAKGEIIEIDPNQLIVNIMSLCIFPFVAKPILQTIFFDESSKEFKKFIQDRKKEVSDFVINSIKVKK